MSQIILVADDDPMIQKLISRMIKRVGFQGEVQVCSDGASAVSYAAETTQAISLALLDTSLYAEGDAALALALQSHQPTIKIVASSGHSPEELEGPRHFQGVHLDGILSKPFGVKDVKELLAGFGLIASDD